MHTSRSTKEWLKKYKFKVLELGHNSAENSKGFTHFKHLCKYKQSDISLNICWINGAPSSYVTAHWSCPGVLSSIEHCHPETPYGGVFLNLLCNCRLHRVVINLSIFACCVNQHLLNSQGHISFTSHISSQDLLQVTFLEHCLYFFCKKNQNLYLLFSWLNPGIFLPNSRRQTAEEKTFK